MQKLLALILAMIVFLTTIVLLAFRTEDNGLRVMLNSIASNPGQIIEAAKEPTPEEKAARWIKLTENQYFTTYADKLTLEASGAAQHRTVRGYFKREFTPEGSAWLAEHSDGKVKPDVITHVIFYQIYNVNTHQGDYKKNPKYYDVHDNLIYDGNLYDVQYCKTGNSRGEEYEPESEQERIKDILFKSFGWDY